MDLNAVWSGEWSIDGCIRRGGNRRRARGSFGGKCGASHRNQWKLTSVVILSREGGDAALPKVLLNFLFRLFIRRRLKSFHFSYERRSLQQRKLLARFNYRFVYILITGSQQKVDRG